MWDGGWEGNFIEFYPSDTTIVWRDSGPGFSKVKGEVGYMNATHVNLEIEKSAQEIARIADELGLKHAPRPSLGVYDVWLEDQFLVEFFTSTSKF